MTRTTISVAIAVALLAIVTVAYTIFLVAPWKHQPHVVVPPPVAPETVAPPVDVSPVDTAPARKDPPAPPTSPKEPDTPSPRVEQVMDAPIAPPSLLGAIPLEVAKEEVREKLRSTERLLEEANRELDDLDMSGE